MPGLRRRFTLMNTLAEAFGLRVAFFVTSVADLSLLAALVWWDAKVQNFLFRSAPEEMQAWFVHDIKLLIDIFAVLTMGIILLTDFVEMCGRSVHYWRNRDKDDKGGGEQ